MFDVATRSRHVIPNPVDHYHKEEPGPGDSRAQESTTLSHFPYSLERSARSDLQ